MTLLKTVQKAFEKKQKPAYKWYHGALFLLGITLLERSAEALAKKANPKVSRQANDKEYYKNLRQPAFAPAAKAFPIAWAICDIALIWGNIRVLNKPVATPGRKEYLALQAASWGVYSLFTALHFGLRSPLNALGLTTVHAALNAASEVVAVRQLKDQQLALAHVPVLSWLSLALPTAATTALWNKDSFYDKGPFLLPDQKWLKAG